MSLRIKLALLTASLVVVVGTGSAIYLYQAVSGGLHRSAFDTLRTRLAGIEVALADSSNLQNAQGSRDGSFEQVQVSGLPLAITAPRAPFSAVQLLGPGGQVLSGYGSSTALVGATTLRRIGAAGFTGLLHLGGETTASPVAVVKSAALPGDYVAGAVSGAPIERELATLARWLFFANVALGLTAFGAGLAISSAALAPIGRMRRQVEEMIRSGYPGTVETGAGKDEVGRLGATFNSLLTKLRNSREAQTQFVAAAGHELRTPLAIMRGELELAAKRNTGAEELRLAVSSAVEETDRLARMAERLLLLARGEQAGQVFHPQSIDVLSSVAGVLERIPVADFHGVRFELQVDEGLSIMCDPEAWVHIMRNVAENAARFTPEGGRVVVRARRRADAVDVEVHDEGPGFGSLLPDVALRPFVRGASRAGVQEGSGLGLAVVREFCAANGGLVELGRSPLGGGLVRLTMNVAEATA